MSHKKYTTFFTLILENIVFYIKSKRKSESNKQKQCLVDERHETSIMTLFTASHRLMEENTETCNWRKLN